MEDFKQFSSPSKRRDGQTYGSHAARGGGLPIVVISDRDVKFTSAFFNPLFNRLGTEVHFSTTYHPQTYGETKQVNRVLEDILRMYVMQRPTKWE